MRKFGEVRSALQKLNLVFCDFPPKTVSVFSCLPLPFVLSSVPTTNARLHVQQEPQGSHFPIRLCPSLALIHELIHTVPMSSMKSSQNSCA